MKPPVRPRTAPRRFGVEAARLWLEIDNDISDWSTKDKRQLLRALLKQTVGRELDIGMLEVAVPGKSETEIEAYLDGLRVRAARSVIQRDQIQRLQEKRRQQQQLRAPLQIWTELAEAATGTLDEVISTAFSQTLMISATEPISQEHSVQRVALTDRTSNALGNGSAGVPPTEPLPPPAEPLPPPISERESSTQPDGNTATSLRASSPEEPQHQDTLADFGKIYRLLSAAVRGSALPELSPFESAVVLDLLMTLPEQLQELSCADLWKHLDLTYRRLTRSRLGDLPDPLAAGCPAMEPRPAPGSPPRAEGSAAPSALGSDWPAACPLNPFMVPVRLLVRREEWESSVGPDADP